MDSQARERAKEHFAGLIQEQLTRIERMKKEEEWVDYADLSPIIVGVCGGDGIGPYISREAQRTLEFLLAQEIDGGRVTFRTIEGLTIENRAAHNQATPQDV